MKTKLSLLALLLLLITINVNSQWFWLNPLPQGNYLSYVKFWGSNGVIIGNGSSILKSSDLGNNWTLSNVPAYNIVHQVFVFDLNNFCLVTEDNLLRRTTNGGVSWFSSSHISGLVSNIFFINMQTGYSVYNSNYNTSHLQLYKTTNGGENWEMNKVDSTSRITHIFFPNETTGYLAGSRMNTFLVNKFLKTTNGGNSWDSINTSPFRGATGLYFVNALTGFMSEGTGKLYKTTNGAMSWDSSAQVGNNSSRFYFINSATGFVSAANVRLKTTNTGSSWASFPDPQGNFYYDGSNTFFSVGSYGKILNSTNNGINYTNSTYSVYSSFMNDIEVIDANTAFIACDNGRILKTMNGGLNWSVFSDITMQYYNSLFFFNSTTGFAAGSAETVGSSIRKTTNGGNNWFIVNAHLFSIFNITFSSSATGYVINKTGQFEKSTDSGANWFTPGVFDAFAAGGLEFVDDNTGFWVGASYITNAQIRKTTNGGYNWTETLFDSIEVLYDVKFKDANTGFACGYYQTFPGYFGAICRTTNQGISWSVQYPPTGMIYELVIADENTIYACCDNGKFLKSTNSGINWNVYQSCYSSYLYSMDFANANTGFAVSDGGIIIKTTNGGGTPIGLNPVSQIVPAEFRLYRNYPNPFNPTTRIKFSIPAGVQGEKVEISVFDVAGRNVKVLVNEVLKAGLYEVSWNAAQFSSGIYFCRMKAGDFINTNKMVLLK